MKSSKIFLQSCVKTKINNESLIVQNGGMLKKAFVTQVKLTLY